MRLNVCHEREPAIPESQSVGVGWSVAKVGVGSDEVVCASEEYNNADCHTVVHTKAMW